MLLGDATEIDRISGVKQQSATGKAESENNQKPERSHVIFPEK